ncbi:hypothetical protein [Streptomyces sp. NPDC005538]|uniref:hypothetical protein n=1 Tax=Streptomyces sp. NPDC005538 TaxID=3157043 RepID=UPI0033BA22C9
MASNALSSRAGQAAHDHDRALLTDFVRRYTTALAEREDSVLSALRDQLEATLAQLEAPEQVALSWTGQVTHPGTQPGQTVVHLTDSSGCAYALRLDDELREALGLTLIDPSDPDEVAAENADCDEQDGPFLEDKTAAALFNYLVNESDERQYGTAHQVHARSDPDALDYLLARGRCGRTRTRR